MHGLCETECPSQAEHLPSTVSQRLRPTTSPAISRRGSAERHAHRDLRRALTDRDRTSRRTVPPSPAAPRRRRTRRTSRSAGDSEEFSSANPLGHRAEPVGGQSASTHGWLRAWPWQGPRRGGAHHERARRASADARRARTPSAGRLVEDRIGGVAGHADDRGRRARTDAPAAGKRMAAPSASAARPQ